MHIKQKNSNANCYIIVKTEGWEGSLHTHPSVVDYPEHFEVVDEAIPDNIQYLNYVNNPVEEN